MLVARIPLQPAGDRQVEFRLYLLWWAAGGRCLLQIKYGMQPNTGRWVPWKPFEGNRWEERDWPSWEPTLREATLAALRHTQRLAPPAQLLQEAVRP